MCFCHTESERLGQWRNSPFRDYLSILDAEWSASDRPLLACSDGSVRVFDISLNQCSSSLAEDAQERISFPLLMPRSAFQAVKSGLQLNLSASTECTNSHKDLILNYISDHIPSNEAGIPERCFRAALQCGDQPQAELWTVASYYLRFHAGKECIPLDTVYDLLCDSSTYRQMAAERAALYQSKPRAYEHTRQLTRDHLLLNDKDKAIALLLNTEPEHGHFYSNHLLACLAAILQPAGCHGNAHSTLKLVATHLIASGHIWQGVEILILNGQVPDACRYLQANHLWEDSARVAKLLLMDKEKGGGTLVEVSEAAEIWRRWASHLSNCRQKFGATLILIAVGAWHRAAELLVHQHMHDAAALLLRAAHQNGLYQASDATQLEFMVCISLTVVRVGSNQSKFFYFAFSMVFFASMLDFFMNLAGSLRPRNGQGMVDLMANSLSTSGKSWMSILCQALEVYIISFVLFFALSARTESFHNFLYYQIILLLSSVYYSHWSKKI